MVSNYQILVVAFTILCSQDFFLKKVMELLLYCRSVDCFRLGWPMRADADFFKTPEDAYPSRLNGVGSLIIQIYLAHISYLSVSSGL